MKTYDLNLLRALHALLETGSVTAAADRMHLSVPAMSHTLARLREAMGDPLFVRAGRALTLTPRARAMREPVARLLEAAQALAAPSGADALKACTRRFVVRAPEGIGLVFGAAVATAFIDEMPLASVQFLPEASADSGALREGRIDLDIGNVRSRDPEIESIELGRQSWRVAVSANVIGSSRMTTRRYASLKHVAVASGPNEASGIDDALDALGLSRVVVLRMPSAHSALIAAARSRLAATVPDRIAGAMAPGLGLQTFALPFDIAPYPLLMAWHPRDRADPAHRWLRDTLQRTLLAPVAYPTVGHGQTGGPRRPGLE
ncbi:MAG: LysR family transcriptional regulator [Lautropia sp.]